MASGFDWVGLLVNWGPMIVIIGIWIFFIMQMRGGRFQTQYQRDCMALARRQAEALERIANLLESKSSK